MKRAFTLIELLVVIAIIAILAAILFPVFAQAKLAAKKAVSISNQKQLGLAILMYSNDYDDMYPRQDGCTLNDSLVTSFNGQPAGTNPVPFCNGGAGGHGYGGYAFRDNHYNWGKWVQPYVKNVQLLYHPVIQPAAGGPSLVGGLYQGEIDGGYAINLAITGALDTWPKTAKWGIRNSWLGGSQTDVPDVAEAMLIMEELNTSVVPGYEYGTTSSHYQLSYAPAAIKEHWEGYFYTNQPTDNHDCYASAALDSLAAPFQESVPLSYCDGHTKAIPVGQFLADTPTAAQYGLSYIASDLCPLSAALYSAGTPNLNLNAPLWGLTGQ